MTDNMVSGLDALLATYYLTSPKSGLIPSVPKISSFSKSRPVSLQSSSSSRRNSQIINKDLVVSGISLILTLQRPNTLSFS